jgi:NAD(P)-dependent dehydrogenase (short-subunit alcohol dehydrogenase family)
MKNMEYFKDKVSLAGRVRVNSISPGWIDTTYTVYDGPEMTLPIEISFM